MSLTDLRMLYSEDGGRVPVTNVNDPVQGRRPASGRRRARFSFKSSASDSLLDIDLKSNFDHLEKPEEFFSAFEKFENAEKELKKIRGEVASNSNQTPPNRTKRQRRPGILGRKASYKHHLPISINSSESVEPSFWEVQTSMPSKTLKNASVRAFSQSSSHPDTLHEMETNGGDLFNASEREGSVDGKAKRGRRSQLLDTLLCSFEDLNAGEEINFLHERLQIQSTNVEKLCLPPLDKVELIDVRMMDDKVDGAKFDGSQIVQPSQVLKDNSLAAILALKGCISQRDLSEDPFSVPYTSDKSSPENSPSKEVCDKSACSSPLSVNPDTTGCKVMDAPGSQHPAKARIRLSCKEKLQSAVTEVDNSIPTSITLERVSENDLHFKPDTFLDRCAGVVDTMDIVRSTSFGGPSQDKADDMLLEASIVKEAPHSHAEVLCQNPNSNITPTSAGLSDNRSPSDVNLDVGGGGISCEVNGIMVGKASDILQEAPASSCRDQSNLDTAAGIPSDGLFEDSNILPEENNQENETSQKYLVERLVKLKAPHKRKNRQRSSARRQSLAEAGMAWKSGVRRSTRIKTKPLEHWRGERFLYARIHDCLPTVIGLKYASPATGGKEPVLKVKSYVSEQYGDLLHKVALH